MSSRQSPRRTFTFMSFSGEEQEVRCDSIVFEPGHVVFYADIPPHIVLAERNENVNALKEVPDSE